MPISLNQTQLYEEYNRLSTFELCIHAQELVQDTINKTTEVAQLTQSIIGNLVRNDQAVFVQRKNRIEELLSGFDNLFFRLRIAGQIVNERKLVKQVSSSSSSSNTSTTTAAAAAQKKELVAKLTKERDGLIEQVRLKNNYLKYSIDQTSDIIWQINAIQTLKN